MPDINRARRYPLIRDTAPVPIGTRLWQMWPGNDRMATAQEEAEFVTDLKERCTKPAPYKDRGVLTATLGALRCGITAADLLARAPGISAADALGAYEHIAGKLDVACAAWDRIVAEPTNIIGYQANRDEAAKLVPVLISSLDSHVASPKFGDLVELYAKQAAEMRAAADLLMDRLVTAHRLEERRELAQRLYDPYPQRDTVWGATAFVARRVTELTPIRVAALLEESIR